MTFAFVRARLIRCNNGTDIEGKPLPGMCMMPSEIDRLVYNGVLYLFEQEEDMRVNDLVPFMRIRQWRREFVSGLHLSTDVYFTIRQVIRDARFIFDAYLPGFQSGLSFMLLDDYQETYTDFDEDAAQYSAFYFRLSREMVVQVNDRRCRHRPTAVSSSTASPSPPPAAALERLALRAVRGVGRDRLLPLPRLRADGDQVEHVALQPPGAGARHPQARPRPVHALRPPHRQVLPDAAGVPGHERRRLREVGAGG